MLIRAESELNISRSAGNAMLIAGIEDTWANRVVFYEGLIHGWRSEVPMTQHQIEYIQLLQKMIDEAKKLRDATTELLGT